MLTYGNGFEIVEKSLGNYSFEKYPAELYEPVRYILQIGGKRIRPVLSLMAHSIFSHRIDVAIKPALGLEVFHNFTLLHDDIMDNASMRRNSPTVHVKWDSNTAILSGDAMLILAYQLIAESEPVVLPEVLGLFSRTALQVCEGQQLDMNFEKSTDVSVDDYLKMIGLKTAVLLAASLATGGITGHTDSENINILYQTGLNLGMAFQLRDDYLDVFADNSGFGKNPGGDIISNKKTFLLLTALESGNENTRREIMRWISMKEFPASDKISAIKQIYQELDVPGKTNSLIESYHSKALQCLEKLKASGSHKKELIHFISGMMSRDH